MKWYFLVECAELLFALHAADEQESFLPMSEPTVEPSGRNDIHSYNANSYNGDLF